MFKKTSMYCDIKYNLLICSENDKKIVSKTNACQRFFYVITLCVCVHACMNSHVILFATPWTWANQTPVHGISQARILELVAISFSRGSSWFRDWICISGVSCMGRWILYCWTAWEALCLPDFYLILIIHVIPEPSTLCLLRRSVYYLHTKNKLILSFTNMICNS